MKDLSLSIKRDSRVSFGTQYVGRARTYLQLFARDRVFEYESVGVKPISGVAGERGVIWYGLPADSVERVAF